MVTKKKKVRKRNTNSVRCGLHFLFFENPDPIGQVYFKKEKLQSIANYKRSYVIRIGINPNL